MTRYSTLIGLFATALGTCFSGAAAIAATSLEIDFDANDAVYDSSRNVIYVSTASSAGFPNGNSILTIDPSNLNIVGQTSAGSEPNRMAISSDGSRVYVGIDGARAFRSFTPATGALGPLVPLLSRFGDPAVAEDFAVSPNNPAVVVVSKDQVGTTADGDLEVFDDSGPIGTSDGFNADANSITFTANDTLVTYNNTSTGYDLKRWNFDGFNLTLENSIRGLVRGFFVEIEAAGGLIYSTNGAVADPETLTLVGSFDAIGAVEPIALNGVTYFLDGGLLRIFDNATFLPCNTIDIAPFGTNVTRLFHAGGDRLGYVTSSGAVGVIQGVVQDSCFATAPVTDVKVNGSDVLVSVAGGDPLDLTLSLDAGSEGGQLADWTIGILYAGGFLPVFSGQAALVSFPDVSVFQGALPPGLYYWIFAVDLNPNGVQEYQYFDSVPIVVN